MSQDYILIDSNGESCKECKSEWNYPDEEDHEETCSHHWKNKGAVPTAKRVINPEEK